MVQEGMVPTTERPEAHVETDHESDTELALWDDGTLQQRRTRGKDSREREIASRPEFPLQGLDGLEISRPILKERVGRGLLSGKLEIRTHCPERK